jgi:hypothetical protein
MSARINKIKPFAIIAFTVFLLQSGVLEAAFVMDPGCQSAYREIIALRFIKAKEIIEKEKLSNPDNDAVLFLENKILFLTAFISEERQSFEKLKSGKDKAISILEKGDDTNPYYRLAQAEILLQTALIKIKFREFFSAGLEIRKANKLLNENAALFPSFMPNLKGLGILHALIGAVPDNYQWIVHMVGFEGNIKQGIGELKSLLAATGNESEYSWLHEETLFLLIFTQHHLLRNDAATKQLIGTVNMNEAGPLLYFAVGNYYNSAGLSSKTLALLKNYQPDESRYPMPYLNFMLGSAMLYDLDAGADKYFQLYISEFKGQNFIKAAWQKLAWIRFINGDTLGYTKLLQKAKTEGNDFADEDKQALKEAEEQVIPNVHLLKSRLLFDGGYYQRALSELGGKNISDFPSLRDQLELTYRMGRIFDKMNQLEKAKGYYESTYANGQRQNWYYAANAALNLGMLYEATGNKTEAIGWYKKCLALRDHEYQNSIDQKAEAGLNRLGK